MNFDELLKAAEARGASDILLSPGAPPALRIEGRLQFATAPLLTPEVMDQILTALLGGGAPSLLRERHEWDAAVVHGSTRFRLGAYLRDGAVAVVLRRIPEQIPTPEALGLPVVVSELAQRPQGLVLFCGAAGQGKSTSQASLVDFLNRTASRHIITVEDPVEFLHASKHSIIDQREVGRDTRSFGDALRTAMRHNPDVLLVGEMRDLETVRAVVTIAETGHLVFSTLHTNDAPQAIDRMVSLFPPHALTEVRAQLSMALAGVVCQRLIPGKDGRLVLAAEILINTPAVATLIREGRTEQIYSQMELDRASGMVTLNHALDALVDRNAVEASLAARYRLRHESRA